MDALNNRHKVLNHRKYCTVHHKLFLMTGVISAGKHVARHYLQNTQYTLVYLVPFFRYCDILPSVGDTATIQHKTIT